jgi:hypothetical protein
MADGLGEARFRFADLGAHLLDQRVALRPVRRRWDTSASMTPV